jgi:hypothetical protein
MLEKVHHVGFTILILYTMMHGQQSLTNLDYSSLRRHVMSCHVMSCHVMSRLSHEFSHRFPPSFPSVRINNPEFRTVGTSSYGDHVKILKKD